jgi:ubiquinone/menaquinone biosynthesis C-methylase UbiE
LKVNNSAQDQTNNTLETQIAFCCPQCKGDLEQQAQGYNCKACPRFYPVVLGIADFRVFPDPYISYDDDWAKGQRVLELGAGMSFEELVALYWRLTPDVPPELAQKYIAGAIGSSQTGKALLKQFQKAELRRPNSELLASNSQPATRGLTQFGGNSELGTRNSKLLELGCGTGGLLVEAAKAYPVVVGVDIAFRWLVIARKRLEEADCSNVLLVCACAQALPFRSGQFDGVVAIHTLEHADTASQQSAWLAEARQALKPRGNLFISTFNRYSLGPEPHMHIWGVGWLPRSWMAGYVRFWKKVKYQHIRLLGYRELQTKLQQAGWKELEFLPPELDEATLGRFSPRLRQVGQLYNRLLRIKAFNKVMLWCGPLLRVVGRADDGEQAC